MCNLHSPYFNDPDEARKHLESLRWPDGAACPHCGGVERVYPVEANEKKKIREGLYHCNDCNKQFTVTVGTVFERSKVGLHKWLAACYLMCSSKKGISAKQLERTLGVTYKTAWFMAHRIREAMRDGSPGIMGGGGGTVEVDETFIGHDTTKKPRHQKKGRGYDHKYKVLTLVEREGRARSFHVDKVTSKTLIPIIREQVAADTHIMTDEAVQYVSRNQYQTYNKLAPHFASHRFVQHGIGEYVRGDVYTNTIEGYFSIFKRGMKGIYQHCGKQHLKRYLCEYDFRYNYREKLGYDDMQRTDMALRGIEGKRITYARPNQK